MLWAYILGFGPALLALGLQHWFCHSALRFATPGAYPHTGTLTRGFAMHAQVCSTGPATLLSLPMSK